MSMEGVAWNSLYKITRAKSGSKPFSKETLKRVLGFARPHRTKLIAFVALSIVMAFLAVATPVLAGQVVDAIVAKAGTGRGDPARRADRRRGRGRSRPGPGEPLAFLHHRRRRDRGPAHQGL